MHTRFFGHHFLKKPPKRPKGYRPFSRGSIRKFIETVLIMLCSRALQGSSRQFTGTRFVWEGRVQGLEGCRKS